MTLAIAALLGVFSWTFIEYAMHYWVGHLTKGRTEFSREHLQHHRIEGYFTPTPKKLAAAAKVLVPLALLGGFGIGPEGLAYAAGFGVMYWLYEWVHRDIHVRAPSAAYGRWARRHHLHHHHRNPNANHGVTTPMWDWVFGTLEPTGRLVVVRSKAPRWLLDDRGEIAAEFVADYATRGGTR